MRAHAAILAAVVAAATAAPGALAYNNGAPHAMLPPLGWSSWVALGPGAQHPIFDFCDTDSVKAAIDAFVSDELGLYKAGYRHFHLDDCWTGPRNATGYLTADPTRFPNGIGEVIDYAHSKGDLAFGLYTCAGTETCVGGRPGSKDHWQQDADFFAEINLDFIKMDWCNTQGMTPETTYPKMSKALNASGNHLSFNLCEWGLDNPWEWADAIAQSWRATGDHTGIWASTKEIVASVAKIPSEYTGRPYGWNDMDMLETGNYAQAAHANGKESNMTAAEYMTEFSMWAINASPLVVTTPIMKCTSAAPPTPVGACAVALDSQDSHAACTLGASFGCYQNGSMWTSNGCRGEFTCNGYNVSCNVDGDGTHVCDCGSGKVTCAPTITDLQKAILLNTEVIAINQDVTPQGRPVSGHEDDLYVWARALSDGSVAVALYNQDDAKASISVDFSTLPAVGWGADTEVSVRDLWAHQDLPAATGSYGPVSVEAHATTLLRLTKA